MSEKSGHIRLVELLSQWIISNLLNGDDGHIFVDHPLESYKKPPIIAHSVPDVFVPQTKKRGIIIGEAKTSNDIENSHTYYQINDFLAKCAEFDDSILVLAVPWDMVPLMDSIARKLKINCGINNVQIRIPEKLSPWE